MNSTGYAAVLAGLAVVGCSEPRGEKPPIFAGEGARIEPQPSQMPLPQLVHHEPPATEVRPADSARLDDPCREPSPPSEDTKLDDFEDGDSRLFKVFERAGAWFTAADSTPSAKLFPSAGAFEPVLLPQADASDDNEYAVHLSASGQKDWGVVLGTTLRWARDGIRCPFNASAFSGIEFRAKGPATLFVSFPTSDTMPPERGGTCTEKCLDSYGKFVRIKEGWKRYAVRWDQLQQRGWGRDVRFDSRRLLLVHFSARSEHLPIDVWVDDIQFTRDPGS